MKCILKTYPYSPSKAFNEHSISDLVNPQIYVCRMQRTRQKNQANTPQRCRKRQQKQKNLFTSEKACFFFFFFFFCNFSTLLVGLDLLTVAVSRSYSRHTTLDRTPLDEGSDRRTDLYLTTHNRHPCPRRDSNPQSQQQKHRRPAPYTERPLSLGRQKLSAKIKETL